ncbi:MAG: DUF4296 domain-containing protein [Bacteroidales bacterium]|nr:DUF4296 domain-containing protein [Bacteroidales bacterium]
MHSQRFLIIILSILLFSCSSGRKENVIPKKDLVSLLVELHITDAIAMNTRYSDYFGGLDSTLLYSTVFEKYGYTKEELTNSIKYYSKNPDDISDIYNEVFSELSKRTEDLRIKNTKYSYGNTKFLWRMKNIRYIKGDTARYPSAHDIPVEGKGTYLIYATIKMLRSDESVNPRITAYFYNPEDTVSGSRIYFKPVPITKSKYTRDYVLLKELKDESYSRLKITIPEYDNKDSLFYKEMTLTGFNLQKLREKKDKKEDS